MGFIEVSHYYYIIVLFSFPKLDVHPHILDSINIHIIIDGVWVQVETNNNRFLFKNGLLALNRYIVYLFHACFKVYLLSNQNFTIQFLLSLDSWFCSYTDHSF